MIGKAGEGQAVRRRSSPWAAAWAATRAIAALTYCSVWNMSTFQSKNRSISAEPRLVIDRTSLQPGNAVHRFFDRPRDRHQHLVDGHHAVVDPDQMRGKVRRGKHRDGNGERQIDAQQCQRQDQEDDGLGVARKPVGRFSA